MKTRIIAMAAALIVLCSFVAGCGSKADKKDTATNSPATASNVAQGEPQVLVDKTAEPKDAYGAPGADKKIMEATSILDKSINPDMDNIAALSDEVIRGTVKKVSYVGIQGMARTVTSVLVTEVYKGDLKKGDLISVYQLGGYIPLAEIIKADHEEFRYKDRSKSEIENTIVKETVDGEEFPEIGEDCLYFLFNNRCPVYPDSAYERVGGQSAKLDAVNKSGKLSFEREDPDEPSNSNAHERFSKDDIEESIEKDECLESNAYLKNE
jgi:hypothetical protein